MSAQLKFTDQEAKVVNYLTSHNNGTVFWEELAQFSKDPQSVKLKTIKKTLSEIKRKYVLAGMTIPFNVSMNTMAADKTSNKDEAMTSSINALDILRQLSQEAPKPQVLVQVKRVINNNPVETLPQNIAQPPLPAAVQAPSAQADFVLDRTMKRVKTKFGSHNLNDNEWEVFKYIHSNVGKLIPISELRDKVVYPQWGSKTPARWFDAIMRIINNMRRQIPGLDRRLLTVKGVETSYLFQ